MRIFFVFLIGLALASCDSNRVYEKYENIPNFKWSQNKALWFEVEIKDTIQRHNIYLNIRNSGSYAYSNLWLFVTTISPGLDKETEKFECELADEVGEWHGSGFGDLFDLQIPFKKSVVFPKAGIYVFKIEQGMRDAELNGIVNAGLRIEKSNY